MDLWREIYSISYSFSLSRRLDGVLRCMRPSRREHNGIMPTSIEIESLRDIISPVKGINFNRKGCCTFFYYPRPRV